ncbi:MAG: antitoxin VapB family protein [Nanoarchaeota archaeon]
MSTKTISISEEAYKRLALAKDRNESFSEIILRHFPKRPLLELAGILSHEEAERLRLRIKESRKFSRNRLKNIAKKLK